MKKLILSLIIAAIGVNSVQGQNQLLKQMNEIKAQNDLYYWEQFSHQLADSAVAYASKRLLTIVNNDRQDKLSLEVLMPNIRFIKITRGNTIQAFAYVRKTSVTGPGTSDVAATSDNHQFVPDAFVQQVMRLKDIQRVYTFLSQQKAEGKVLQFGALKDVDDYSSFDLILFDLQSKEAICLLSPIVYGNERTNLLTGASDSLDNYPKTMVAVIWYIK